MLGEVSQSGGVQGLLRPFPQMLTWDEWLAEISYGGTGPSMLPSGACCVQQGCELCFGGLAPSLIGLWLCVIAVVRPAFASASGSRVMRGVCQARCLAA